MKKRIIEEKSFDFALAIIELYKTLSAQNEYVFAKQILRSGTSIGANVQEAQAAQSKKDFIAKMSISLKEARETLYWLRLLETSRLINFDFTKLKAEIHDIIRILTAIIKTAQKNQQS